jgi:predicted acylesterase/phospholipase RssA
LLENVVFVTPDFDSQLLLTEEPAPLPGIGLALGGGFARGYAHLGVLRVFEEQEIPISFISGSSMGSIVGAAYASGAPLHRMIKRCREIRFRDFARWRVSRFGLASNDRLGALVQRFFDSRQFEELLIPLAIVATDLGTGDPVIFKQGSLSEAIRASCAFPGLFEPIQIGTRLLADGGLVAPVPTRAARDLGAQIVVGISVGLHDGQRGGSVTRTSSCGLPCNHWLGTILSVSTKPLKPALRLPDQPFHKSRNYSAPVPGRSKSSSRAAKANSSSRKPFGNVPPALTSVVVFRHHALGGKWGESPSLLLPYWWGRFGDSAFAHASLNSLLSEA